MNVTQENVSVCLNEMADQLIRNSFFRSSSDEARVLYLVKSVRINIFNAKSTKQQTIKVFDNNNQFCGTTSVANRNAVAVIRPTLCRNQRLVFYAPVITFTCVDNQLDIATIAHEGSHLFSYGDYHMKNNRIIHHWGSLSTCFRIRPRQGQLLKLQEYGCTEVNELLNDMMADYFLSQSGWGTHPKMKHPQFYDACNLLVKQAWEKKCMTRIELLRAYVSDIPCPMSFLSSEIQLRIRALFLNEHAD